MPTQAEQLPNNIDKMIGKIDTLKEKTFLVGGIPKINIKDALLTPRQMAKKWILFGSGVLSVTGQLVEKLGDSAEQVMSSTADLSGNGVNPNNDVSKTMDSYEMRYALNASQMLGQVMTPEAAHFIVYGKFKKDANGNLIDNEINDPDCVLTEIAMPDSHPTFKEIMLLVKKIARGLKLLGYKQGQLLDEVAQAGISIPASITAIAAAAVILPPGAGVPVAFSAFQSMVSTIMNLLSKISELDCEEIESLNYIPILIEAQKIDAIMGLINAQIIAINAVLDAIDGVTKIIPSVPSPPGQGGTPPDPLKVEVKILPDPPQLLNNVVLSATANGGSWEYTFNWKTTNDGYNTELSNTEQCTLYQLDQDIDIKLTVKDKKTGDKVVKTIPIRVL